MITLYLHWQLKVLANSVFLFLVLKNTMFMPDAEVTNEIIDTNSKETLKVQFFMLSQLQ